jgi:glycerol-3-phosphate O-acyltransferase
MPRFNPFKKSIGLRQWVISLLTDPQDLFLCYLPGRLGMISTWLLRRFYSGISISPEQIAQLKQLPQDAILVYANKSRNNFEYMFYHTRYGQRNLKVPEIGLDNRVIIWQRFGRLIKIGLGHCFYFLRNRKRLDPYDHGFIYQELTNDKAAFISLLSEKGFKRWFVKKRTDPIQYLIKIQAQTERPIIIVPQLIFFSRKAEKTRLSLIDILFGTENQPGSLRRLVKLFKGPGKVYAEISEPLNLQDFLVLPENRDKDIKNLSSVLRKKLLRQLNRHRQTITGPVIKTTEELKQSILTSERLHEFMEKHAVTKNISVQKVHKQADEFIDEIAAKYSNTLVTIAEKVLNWIFNMMFDGLSVDLAGLAQVKKMSQKGPLILIPSHKSHIDYLVLSYVFYRNNMALPLIAAGKNLSFWPLGPIFRRGGAFFIRRTFKGAVLYSKVFAGYIEQLLKEGFNIELFIEGGRSRTGKLLMPKLGLLSIILNAARERACEDLFFVPIFVGYDRVLEEDAYLHELEGGEKKPESLMQVIQARKVLKKRWGRIYIKFHTPLAMNQLLSEQDMVLDRMTPKEVNRFCRDMGHRIIHAIDKVSVVTPHALVAGALLNCAKDRIPHEDIFSYADTYLQYLYTQKVSLADTLIFDQVRATEQALDAYVSRNFVERLKPAKTEDAADAEYRVNTNKRPSLEYYKNNAVTFFVQPAFTALSILENDAFQFSASNLHAGYGFLQDVFKNEFAHDLDQTAEYAVRKCIKAFIDDAILMPHPTLPDTYNLTSAGFRRLKRFAAFLKTYFESYWVVLNVLMLYPKKTVDTKRRLKKIASRGERMYKRKEISRKEALSRMNYVNALTFFNSKGINGSYDMEKIEFYSQVIQKYLGCLS